MVGRRICRTKTKVGNIPPQYIEYEVSMNQMVGGLYGRSGWGKAASKREGREREGRGEDAAGMHF